MAGASLLALLDDIATVLDDVALMTKVAAKKTAGVLGDDLALNAEQVSGVRAERELPVVWAVAKGSFINKLILVPAAMLISIFIPVLITPLLMLGGAYLCFEGAEKILHKLMHKEEAEKQLDFDNAELPNDLVAYEKTKIRGAIRTDFILSAEIIVIALGSLANDTSIGIKFLVLSLIAIVMTVGVYGLVACIVKLDDIGFLMMKNSGQTTTKYRCGNILVNLAPKLMRFLAIIGTIAMFTVGGSIIAHGIPPFHYVVDFLNLFPLSTVTNIFSEALVGIFVGIIIVGEITLFNLIRKI